MSGERPGVEEVRDQILARLAPLPAELVPLEAAGGRTLARPVVAGEALPPFDNTAMDGFALRSEDTAAAAAGRPVRLRVIATVAAGDASLPRVGAGEAARIFTGAPLPPGADAVVPFEDVHGSTAATPDSVATVELARPVRAGTSVRRRGEDLEPGQEVFPTGTRLNPAAIGLLAALGIGEVLVGRRLRVAVHSSGDELVPIDHPLTPGKIRNSNLYALCARLEAWGAEPLPRPVLPDDPDAIRAGLEATLALQPDAILTTGGISAGDLDHIRGVARERGEDVAVRAVNMKPGKPLVDGTLGGVPFFGLPGNPAACLVSFEIFVRPALALLERRADGIAPRRRAWLAEDLRVMRAGRRQFLRATLRHDRESGQDLVASAGGQGSHLLLSFAHASCLIDLDEQTSDLSAGDPVDIVMLGGTGEARA